MGLESSRGCASEERLGRRRARPASRRSSSSSMRRAGSLVSEPRRTGTGTRATGPRPRCLRLARWEEEARHRARAKRAGCPGYRERFPPTRVPIASADPDLSGGCDPRAVGRGQDRDAELVRQVLGDGARVYTEESIAVSYYAIGSFAGRHYRSCFARVCELPQSGAVPEMQALGGRLPLPSRRSRPPRARVAVRYSPRMSRGHTSTWPVRPCSSVEDRRAETSQR